MDGASGRLHDQGGVAGLLVRRRDPRVVLDLPGPGELVQAFDVPLLADLDGAFDVDFEKIILADDAPDPVPFLLWSTLTYALAAPYRQEGLNLRMIVSAANEPRFHGKEVLVLVDKVPVPAKGFTESVRFWGLKDSLVTRVQDHESVLGFRQGQSPRILLTSKDIKLPCLKRYFFKQKEYKLFVVEQSNIAELEVILSKLEKTIATENFEQNKILDTDQMQY